MTTDLEHHAAKLFTAKDLVYVRQIADDELSGLPVELEDQLSDLPETEDELSGLPVEKQDDLSGLPVEAEGPVASRPSVSKEWVGEAATVSSGASP